MMQAPLISQRVPSGSGLAVTLDAPAFHKFSQTHFERILVGSGGFGQLRRCLPPLFSQEREHLHREFGQVGVINAICALLGNAGFKCVFLFLERPQEKPIQGAQSGASVFSVVCVRRRAL